MANVTKEQREHLLNAIFTATQDSSKKLGVYAKSEDKFRETVKSCLVTIIGEKDLNTERYHKVKSVKTKIDELIAEIEGKAIEGGFSKSHAKNTVSKTLTEDIGLKRRETKKPAKEETKPEEKVTEDVQIEIVQDAEPWQKAYAFILNISGQDATKAKAMALKVHRAFDAAIKSGELSEAA